MILSINNILAANDHKATDEYSAIAKNGGLEKFQNGDNIYAAKERGKILITDNHIINDIHDNGFISILRFINPNEVIINQIIAKKKNNRLIININESVTGAKLITNKDSNIFEIRSCMSKGNEMIFHDTLNVSHKIYGGTKNTYKGTDINIGFGGIDLFDENIIEADNLTTQGVVAIGNDNTIEVTNFKSPNITDNAASIDKKGGSNNIFKEMKNLYVDSYIKLNNKNTFENIDLIETAKGSFTLEDENILKLIKKISVHDDFTLQNNNKLNVTENITVNEGVFFIKNNNELSGDGTIKIAKRDMLIGNDNDISISHIEAANIVQNGIGPLGKSGNGNNFSGNISLKALANGENPYKDNDKGVIRLFNNNFFKTTKNIEAYQHIIFNDDNKFQNTDLIKVEKGNLQFNNNNNFLRVKNIEVAGDIIFNDNNIFNKLNNISNKGNFILGSGNKMHNTGPKSGNLVWNTSGNIEFIDDNKITANILKVTDFIGGNENVITFHTEANIANNFQINDANKTVTLNNSKIGGDLIIGNNNQKINLNNVAVGKDIVLGKDNKISSKEIAANNIIFKDVNNNFITNKEAIINNNIELGSNNKFTANSDLNVQNNVIMKDSSRLLTKKTAKINEAILGDKSRLIANSELTINNIIANGKKSKIITKDKLNVNEIILGEDALLNTKTGPVNLSRVTGDLGAKLIIGGEFNVEDIELATNTNKETQILMKEDGVLNINNSLKTDNLNGLDDNFGIVNIKTNFINEINIGNNKKLAEINFEDTKQYGIKKSIHANQINLAGNIKILEQASLHGKIHISDNTSLNLDNNHLILTENHIHTASGNIRMMTKIDTSTLGKIIINNNATLDLSSLNNLTIDITKMEGFIDPLPGETKEYLFITGGNFINSNNIIINSLASDGITLSSNDNVMWKLNDYGKLEHSYLLEDSDNDNNDGDVNDSDNNIDDDCETMDQISEATQEESLLQNDNTNNTNQESINIANDISTNIALNNSTMHHAFINKHIVNLGSRMNNSMSNTTGIASGDNMSDHHNISMWLDAYLGNAKRDKHTATNTSTNDNMIKEISGYKTNYTGFSSGIDMHASDNLILGAALGFSRSDIKFKDNNIGDKSNNSSFMMSLYGNYYFKHNIFATLIASYNKHEIDHNTNRASINGSVAGVASAKYNVNHYTIETQIGQIYQINNFSLIPSVGLIYNNIGKASYTENTHPDNNVTAYNITRNKINSLNLACGLEGKYFMLVNKYNNSHFVPHVKLGYNYDVGDKNYTVNYKNINDDSESIDVISRIKKMFLFDIGFDVITNDIKFGLNYELNKSSGYISHQFSTLFKLYF